MEVVMQKVYSHYKGKMRTAIEEEDHEKIARMLANKKEIEEKWGEVELILEGNDGADKLANWGRTLRKNKGWIGGSAIQVTDEDGVNIGRRKEVIRRIREEGGKLWRKQAREKTPECDIEMAMR